MIHRNIEFHNVTELLTTPGQGGLALRRFPESLRLEGDLNFGARSVSKSSVCTEIRFVIDARRIQVYIGQDQSPNMPVLIYKGDYMVRSEQLKPGTVNLVELNEPERFGSVEKSALTRTRFSPDVWRIVFTRMDARFFDIDTMGHEIRPPTASEKPKFTMLTYGSSITMGSGSSLFYNGYSAQLAKFLKVDHLNLGLAGSCHVEKSLSDHFAQRKDWDLALFELGVNMRWGYTPEQYEDRVSYLFNKVITAHPEKHLFFVTIIPNYAPYLLNKGQEADRDLAFSEIIRKQVKKCNSPFVHLIEGSDVLPEFSGLGVDLLHPSDEGHLQMGLNLSRLIKPHLENV